MSRIDNDAVGQTQFFNNIGITQTSVITLPTINVASTDATLNLDLLDNGNLQAIAGSTLTPEAAADLAPPEALISFNPQTKDLSFKRKGLSFWC